LDAAEFAGCYEPSDSPPDLKAIADCMREAPIERLVTAMALYKHQEESEGRLGFDARVTNIQAPGLSHEYFMPKHPFEILQAGEGLPVPVVLGATRHDGSFPLDDIYNNYIIPKGLDKNETFIRNDLMPTLLRALGRDAKEKLFDSLFAVFVLTLVRYHRNLNLKLINNKGIRDDTGELYHAMTRTYFREAASTPTLPDKLPGMMDVRLHYRKAKIETLIMLTHIKVSQSCTDISKFGFFIFCRW
jgi:hypothetical protein